MTSATTGIASPTATGFDPPIDAMGLDAMQAVQDRVLWLATSMVHHANHLRPTRSGLKVGGHQASSASMVSIMTALYFDHLRAGDRVSVKPHASPVLHAINYLLGRLDRRYLTELRAFGGLQSYPSRTKDPDPVDFSTGSVGIGATATIWNVLARRYVGDHFGTGPGGRSVALVGDAELDEGAIWEALVDPVVPQLGELLWIVDLNRQSLDRVVPDIAAGRIGAMFSAAGWQTIPVKYGRRLQALFERDGGDALRERIDEMSNEEYQHLLRTPAAGVRSQICTHSRLGTSVTRVLADLDDDEVALHLRDLGGHDLTELGCALERANAVTDRPTVIFAYTIKAWRLPTQGHPGNHSALLSQEQWETLARELGADPDDPWAPLDPDSPAGRLCATASERLRPPTPDIVQRVAPVPAELSRRAAPLGSTQQALGRILTDLSREAPDVSRRVVTVSPDVASSTNLGGWINRVGVWNPSDRNDWFADDPDVLMRWKETQAGQHVELGIAETNLVGLLGELGATWSRDGQPLLPIGTLYDPFVTRALEPWSFGIYAGGQSILIGTPSGVTLAPEGGAHQSLMTASIGLEQPQCVAWEPCFAQDLEWTFLHALGQLGRQGGTSSYFRLSTRPIDQALVEMPDDPELRERRRRDVLDGGYVLRQSAGPPQVVLVGMGAVMPGVIEASRALDGLAIPNDVICLTSADLVFRAMQSRNGLDRGATSILRTLFPRSRTAPIVSVVDGHPHTLAFLAAINGTPMACLGVNDFGQVGDIDDLYGHFQIDADTIVGASLDLLDGPLE